MKFDGKPWKKLRNALRRALATESIRMRGAPLQELFGRSRKNLGKI